MQRQRAFHLNRLLRVSTIPGHPFNADYLYSRLKPMKLAQRDAIWTAEISGLTLYNQSSVPDLIVKWAFHVQPQLVSNEQALLVARMLAWFFSSNHKAFRLRATLAAIRILNGHCDQAAQLVRDFHNCNDPYIVERVFAVACGVAMREQNNAALQTLAQAVYETVFRGKVVPAHILLRDYARCVLELAYYRRCLPGKIKLQDFRPPYRSRWPRIWPEQKVRAIESDEGWSTIKYSVQPERTGMYGDFGRYVMQAHVHQFSQTPLNQRFDKEKGKVPFDAMTARRWVLQRIKQLGWTPQHFKRYEDELPCKGRQRCDIEEVRPERISKKYQWIALHELQAYLSDHFHLALEWGCDEPALFRGTWDLWARDFDPSQPLRDLPDRDSSESADASPKPRSWWNRYPDPFSNESLVADREAWVVSKPERLNTLIELCKSPQLKEDSLVLAGYYRWKEELPYHTSERNYGQLEMWTHVRSWLVRREDKKQFLRLVGKLHFFGVGCRLVEIHDGWFGEYPWGEAHHNLQRWCEERDEWLREVPTATVQTVCSYENKVWGIIPSPEMCKILGVRWKGKDFEFVDPSGALVAFSPFSDGNTGTPPSIVSRRRLTESLQKSGWEIVWGVLGQRYCFSSDEHKHIVPKDSQFSAVFHLGDGKLEGGLTKHLLLDIPRREESAFEKDQKH